jgi:hypothetical protein
MKVFASRFLESVKTELAVSEDEWTWQPANPDVKKVYASGMSTQTMQSTYAGEKDNRYDADRPNEGFLV